MSKQYLAFVGNKNCTYGKPHPATGRFNKYGKLVSFDSKKERDEFCDNWDSQYQCYPVATNRKEAKSLFCAGMSQDQFDEYLYIIENERHFSHISDAVEHIYS